MSASLDRQLAAMGVDADALDAYRRDRGLPPLRDLPLSRQESVCQWLLRGGARRFQADATEVPRG